MKKNDLLLFLEEGLTIEEVPLLALLDEIEELVENSDYNMTIKKELEQGIAILKKETVEHSEKFMKLLSSVTKSDKDEY